jgi:hypothetical protein
VTTSTYPPRTQPLALAKVSIPPEDSSWYFTVSVNLLVVEWVVQEIQWY